MSLHSHRIADKCFSPHGCKCTCFLLPTYLRSVPVHRTEDIHHNSRVCAQLCLSVCIELMCSVQCWCSRACRKRKQHLPKSIHHAHEIVGWRCAVCPITCRLFYQNQFTIVGDYFMAEKQNNKTARLIKHRATSQGVFVNVNTAQESDCSLLTEASETTTFTIGVCCDAEEYE